MLWPRLSRGPSCEKKAGARYGVGNTVDSQKLEHGCRMIYAGVPSFFGLGLEDGHVPTFWLLLY